MVSIRPGYNTKQALGYNYRYWHEMFNARQLLCLSLLAERIRKVPDPEIRDLFTCLFSGILEYNNLFTSYKGEGTGAVRNMFAHHILKPERLPVEANIWGTPKSSGSFLTMFKRRICRALDYSDDPFELKLSSKNGRRTTERIYGLSSPLGSEISSDYATFERGSTMYLSCGDSSATDIVDGSVDAIISDPPFFDNIHYSELADFFYVWQRYVLGAEGLRSSPSTRSRAEVQTGDFNAFTDRLAGVMSELHRVLSDEGVLAFTYHHSRSEGWCAVLVALMEAGFVVTAVHPVKSEISVAIPKTMAKEPIDLDIIFVCRKRSCCWLDHSIDGLWNTILPVVSDQVARFKRCGRDLSRNDTRVIVMAQLIRHLSHLSSLDVAVFFLESNSTEIEALIHSFHEF